MVDTLLAGTVLLVYALLNGASFIAYYRDKKLAERNIWRTPEQRLLILALFGPFGAFAAMRLFRHKTQKAKFRLVSLFLCLHLVLFAGLALGFA
ncbi:MAG: DUF1294 domain-containing protein [Methanomicrobiales archaeon HGW-Methanomicrobiales-2]|jgi:uncharacterized membrane protein YsdA (DUF1294 family)|nr:MAG: DUF1294 domain-containing protein [Methanomicrobiales archaeon HGW-Methanomicrobiales-2]